MADKIRNAMGEVSSPTTDHMASSTDGASGGTPPRKEPVFKEKPERKLPVFADEYRPHSDDDDAEMSAFSSDRKRTAQQMTNTTLQGVVSSAMVDGKIYIDFGDLHVTHSSVTSYVQLRLIIYRCF